MTGMLIPHNTAGVDTQVQMHLVLHHLLTKLCRLCAKPLVTCSQYLSDNGCFCPSTCPDLNPAVAREQAAIIEKSVADSFKKDQSARAKPVDVSTCWYT